MAPPLPANTKNAIFPERLVASSPNRMTATPAEAERREGREERTEAAGPGARGGRVG